MVRFYLDHFHELPEPVAPAIIKVIRAARSGQDVHPVSEESDESVLRAPRPGRLTALGKEGALRRGPGMHDVLSGGRMEPAQALAIEPVNPMGQVWRISKNRERGVFYSAGPLRPQTRPADQPEILASSI
jgi:hypothetical protein